MMIKRYRFGTPFPTEAVASELPITDEPLTKFDYDGAAHTFTRALKADDCVYGLGENVRGINKRGWRYVSDNEDDPETTEDRNSLYGSHNFVLLTSGKRCFGAFFDCAERVEFDIGYTRADTMVVTADNVDLYLITGKDIKSVVREFLLCLGTGYIAPKWAFGFGQSRWGYRCEKDIRDVVTDYRKNDMPLDTVYLDIDYMQDYKNFTVNETRYPDLKGLVRDMKREGVRLIPIIDAACKAKAGYSVYDEGKKRGYFCKDEKGKPYLVGVWPGESVLCDVLNADARRWFGSNYKVLLDLGIEGFWNDMNEPALFYSKHRLAEVLKEVASLRGANMPTEEYSAMLSKIASLANNREDYREFYHETPVGRVSHDKVHNLYGYNMTRAAAEYFSEYDPDKRYLLFSRSSYTGMGRYGGIWMGDNSSWWAHILLNLKMLPSLNMCGLSFIGADIGGFGGNTTEDLLLRWMQLGLFVPLMRNHSSLNSRDQECYRFPDREAFLSLLNTRYALIPYLYSEYVKCVTGGEMMFRPLSFEYPDDLRCRLEDQLFVGESIMICPVYEQNARGRCVYLPAPMKLIRMKDGRVIEEKQMRKGDHYIEYPMDEAVFFLRRGCVMPLGKRARCVDELSDEVTFIKNIARAKEYTLYVGAGERKSEMKDALRRVRVEP